MTRFVTHYRNQHPKCFLFRHDGQEHARDKVHSLAVTHFRIVVTVRPQDPPQGGLAALRGRSYRAVIDSVANRILLQGHRGSRRTGIRPRQRRCHSKVHFEIEDQCRQFRIKNSGSIEIGIDIIIIIIAAVAACRRQCRTTTTTTSRVVRQRPFPIAAVRLGNGSFFFVKQIVSGKRAVNIAFDNVLDASKISRCRIIVIFAIVVVVVVVAAAADSVVVAPPLARFRRRGPRCVASRRFHRRRCRRCRHRWRHRRLLRLVGGRVGERARLRRHRRGRGSIRVGIRVGIRVALQPFRSVLATARPAAAGRLAIRDIVRTRCVPERLPLLSLVPGLELPAILEHGIARDPHNLLVHSRNHNPSSQSHPHPATHRIRDSLSQPPEDDRIGTKNGNLAGNGFFLEQPLGLVLFVLERQ
mmetsp:Transcript_23255/g.64491  ORF Transcript_23255/g.64491 Transcript_23255/m.64491 type:complete len:414 (-) Transcript_23255:1262-2503(-)